MSLIKNQYDQTNTIPSSAYFLYISESSLSNIKSTQQKKKKTTQKPENTRISKKIASWKLRYFSRKDDWRSDNLVTGV